MVALAALLGCCGAGGEAHAQARSRPPARASSSPLRPGSFELSVGGGWQGPVALGSSRAALTGNQGTPAVGLFDTRSEIEARPAFETRLGIHVTRAFAIEGAFRFARPRLVTRITADFEDAEDVSAVQTFSQFAFEAGGVIHLTGARAGALLPFLSVGAGYLRELHSGRAVVETGQLAHVGAGVKVLFSGSRRGLIRTIGIRADARFNVRRGGIEVDEDEPLRTYATAMTGLVVGF